MSRTETIEKFGTRERRRAALMSYLLSLPPGGWWTPIAELRAATDWPSDNIYPGVGSLRETLRSAEHDGLIEFKSGEFRGRASVRLKVQLPPAAPAKENA